MERAKACERAIGIQLDRKKQEMFSYSSGQKGWKG